MRNKMKKTLEERIENTMEEERMGIIPSINENTTKEEMMEIIPIIYKWFKNKGLGNPYTLNSNKKMRIWLKRYSSPEELREFFNDR